MQDLAGMRIVTRSDRRGQDAVVQDLVTLFADCPRPPKVVDRRAAPVHGYRAVHLIVFPEGMPVEIQVRTRRQHEWAELFEMLADRVGRGIRYGEAPKHWWDPHHFDAMQPFARRLLLSAHASRVSVVRRALTVAEVVDAVEVREHSAPGGCELSVEYARADEALSELRAALDDL